MHAVQLLAVVLVGLAPLVGSVFTPRTAKGIVVVALLAAVCYGVMLLLPASWSDGLRLCLNTVLIVLFVAYTVWRDVPLSGLPVVGRYFR